MTLYGQAYDQKNVSGGMVTLHPQPHHMISQITLILLKFDFQFRCPSRCLLKPIIRLHEFYDLVHTMRNSK